MVEVKGLPKAAQPVAGGAGFEVSSDSQIALSMVNHILSGSLPLEPMVIPNPRAAPQPRTPTTALLSPGFPSRLSGPWKREKERHRESTEAISLLCFLTQRP